MKNVVQDLTSAGIDWQREKWQSGLGSKFIHQGEKNAVKYADEVIVLSKGVQDYFKETYGRETHFIPNGVNGVYMLDQALWVRPFLRVWCPSVYDKNPARILQIYLLCGLSSSTVKGGLCLSGKNTCKNDDFVLIYCSK